MLHIPSKEEVPMDADKDSKSQLVKKSGASGTRRYVPNEIPSGDLLISMIFSPLLLAYGTYGIWIDAIFIPGGRGGVFFHGFAAWIMYGAFVSAVCAMVSVCLDHYDRRNNELKYQQFGRVTKLIALSLFMLCCCMHATGYTGGTKRLGALIALYVVAMFFGLLIMESHHKKRSTKDVLPKR
jgi:hypothetical protein